jgi:hypothetical protein
MGACGGKTCPSLIARIFLEEGIPLTEVTDLSRRPLFMEVPMGVFAGLAVGESEQSVSTDKPACTLCGDLS